MLNKNGLPAPWPGVFAVCNAFPPRPHSLLFLGLIESWSKEEEDENEDEEEPERLLTASPPAAFLLTFLLHHPRSGPTFRAMFDTIRAEVTTAADKLAHLRRFL